MKEVRVGRNVYRVIDNCPKCHGALFQYDDKPNVKRYMFGISKCTACGAMFDSTGRLWPYRKEVLDHA